MSAAIKPIPEGHHGAIPYPTVSNASEAIAFYKAAFGAVEVLCIEHGGKVGHAELKIGEARIMLCDEFPDHDALSPQTIGGTPVMIQSRLTRWIFRPRNLRIVPPLCLAARRPEEAPPALCRKRPRHLDSTNFRVEHRPRQGIREDVETPPRHNPLVPAARGSRSNRD